MSQSKDSPSSKANEPAAPKSQGQDALAGSELLQVGETSPDPTPADSQREYDLDIENACHVILSGGVVAIPTETVYGIAASINSEKGLRRIFEIKARPFFDPLIVHVASLHEAATLVARWPALADFIARSFWPGPLTLVLPKSQRVNSLITSGLQTVAIRFPEHPMALELIRAVGSPLAAPSANKFGHTSPSQASHVRGEFASEVADGTLLILDGGDCQVGVESTVIAFGHDRALSVNEKQSIDDDYNLIRILRPGGVTHEMLQGALDRWSHPVTLMPNATNSEEAVNTISAPGQMKHHYMPRVPLIILNEMIRLPFNREQEAVIRNALTTDLIDESAQDAPKSISFIRIEELELSADPSLAARELYQEMRYRSEIGATCLIVYKTAERTGGLWSAIWDRLSKAASFDFTLKSF